MNNTMTCKECGCKDINIPNKAQLPQAFCPICGADLYKQLGG